MLFSFPCSIFPENHKTKVCCRCSFHSSPDQLHEIEAYTIYTRLAAKLKDQKNAEILRNIAAEELEHYRMLTGYTGREIKTRKRIVWWFFFVSRVLGLTFGLKLMEHAEQNAQKIDYADLDPHVPDVTRVLEEEEEHEHSLLDMLNEQRLDYMGSIVLGLNDALVELTGTLAGLSLAFQQTRLIALSGLITGIAASLSMASSDYLAKRPRTTIMPCDLPYIPAWRT